MTLKHSPAPWRVETVQGIEDVYPVSVNAGVRPICDLPRLTREGIPQQQADATLIAAAPDMLQLLRNAWDAYMADPNPYALGNTMNEIEALLWRLDGNE